MKSVCCEWLQNHLQRAGEKGFSVIAYRDGERRRFCLQARPFENDVVEKYGESDPETGTVCWPALVDSKGVSAPWVISMDLPLRYCPYCSEDLLRLIQENRDLFDELAAAG